MENRRWLTVAQAAELLQLSAKTLYRKVARRADLCGGPPPVVKVISGKKGIRLDGKELERRLEQQLQASAGTKRPQR